MASQIRPMNLPADLDAWIAVTAEGFQYPDNPEWNYSPEEIENNVAGIRSLKQIWPLFAVLRVFSADARDMIRGFFYEEDGKVVGNISCQRRGEAWYISDVVVLPEYRGKGIARRLVEVILEDIRARGGRQVSLDVVSGNLPAHELYKAAGFQDYTSLAFYEMKGYHPLLAVGSDDCRVEEIKGNAWRLRYDFWKRVTPESVQEFSPVTESAFRRSAFTRAFHHLWRWMSGEKFQLFALLGGEGRDRAGGGGSHQADEGGRDQHTGDRAGRSVRAKGGVFPHRNPLAHLYRSQNPADRVRAARLAGRLAPGMRRVAIETQI